MCYQVGYSSIITRLVRLTQEQVVAEVQLVVQPNGVLGPWVARGTKDKGGLSWRSDKRGSGDTFAKERAGTSSRSRARARKAQEEEKGVIM